MKASKAIDRDCKACEAYKAYWFVQAVKSGIDTDVAREMAQSIGTAWMMGYLYAKSHESK